MGKLTGESTTEIDAPIADVWASIVDVLDAPKWQGGMKAMTALETDAEGRTTLAEVVADGKVKELKSHQRFSYEEPTRLSWSQEKGDLKSVEGAWVLEDLGDGRTKATFQMAADPGRVLSMTIRGPVESALRAMLVNSRAGELAEWVAKSS